jgi:hypothetical protein
MFFNDFWHLCVYGLDHRDIYFVCETDQHSGWHLCQVCKTEELLIENTILLSWFKCDLWPRDLVLATKSIMVVNLGGEPVYVVTWTFLNWPRLVWLGLIIFLILFHKLRLQNCTDLWPRPRIKVHVCNTKSHSICIKKDKNCSMHVEP